MNEHNKEINRISWIISACIEQFRFVGNDIKRVQKVPNFYSSHSFNTFVKHFQMALTLFKTAEKNWGLLIKNGRLNQNNVQNLYLLYIKRGSFQFKLSLDSLIKMSYEQPLGQNSYFLSLKEKINNLYKIVNQLDKTVNNLTNFSF